MRLSTWLGIGLILALLAVDLKLVAWLFSTTTWELFAAVVSMVVGLLKAAMTAIASALASVL